MFPEKHKTHPIESIECSVILYEYSNSHMSSASTALNLPTSLERFAVKSSCRGETTHSKETLPSK